MYLIKELYKFCMEEILISEGTNPTYSLSRTHKTLSTVMWLLMWILLALCITAFIAIFVTEKNVKFQLDRSGFNSFFEIYGVPIKLGVATFAVLAVWLTLERMEQTERQLQIISDNNLFNNYYKHIEEFSKYLSEDTLLQMLKDVVGPMIRSLLMIVHKSYYCEDYKRFVPHVNIETMSNFRRFHGELANSQFARNDVNFHDVKTSELKKLCDLIDDTARGLIDPVTERKFVVVVREFLKKKGMTEEQVRAELELFQQVFTIYWADALYDNVISFDGDSSELTMQTEIGPKCEAYFDSVGVRM